MKCYWCGREKCNAAYCYSMMKVSERQARDREFRCAQCLVISDVNDSVGTPHGLICGTCHRENAGVG